MCYHTVQVAMEITESQKTPQLSDRSRSAETSPSPGPPFTLLSSSALRTRKDAFVGRICYWPQLLHSSGPQLNIGFRRFSWNGNWKQI